MDIAVKDISIHLGKKPRKQILDQVSFTAYDGEFLSLLGASGAGKTTLLKILAGILIQDKGSISFGEECIDTMPSHKRKVGFVFQDIRLFPHMNVEENIAFPCKMAGMPKKKRIERAQYLLECVHLAGFGSREVFSLSGGQQQRVALARALAGNPRVLLLDEPFSGLDENLRDEMRSLVLRLHRDFNITTIMVTHDAIEALEMSDRVVYMSAGKVIQNDTPQNLYQSPTTAEIASCFGECSVLHGEVSHGVFRRAALEVPAPACANGSAQAVIRHRGVRAKASEDGALRVRCGVFRGEDYMVRVDVAGETLNVVRAEVLEPETAVDVSLDPASCFVYPTHERS